MKLPEPYSKSDPDLVNAIIETPKGCRNKYDYTPKQDLFELSKVLPAGTVFPLDFGFISGTLAADGDPLDILVISDIPGCTGCLIQCRVLGVLEAVQTEKDGTEERNDRILAVQNASVDHSMLRTIKDVDKHLLDEVEHFFVYYNEMSGKKFKMLGVKGPKAARRLIDAHIKKYKKRR
ncbi:MAG: inorganic diphosphatase [Bacteroidetes bacterium]|nr:inorganic diphosphatase [Bacteroidota bacterium]